MPARYVVGAFIAAFICHVSFSQAQLYDTDALLDEVRSIKSILIRWSTIFLGLAATTALAHRPDFYSRGWFAAFYVGGAAMLAGQRAVVAMAMRQWIRTGYVTQSVVLVGANDLAAGLIRRLEHNRSGIRITGVFDDRSGRTERFIRGVPVLGSVDDLLEFTKTHATDLVVVTLPISAADRLNAVVAKLRHQPLNIRVLPGEIGLDRISPIRLSRNELPGVQLIAVADRPISEFALFVKGTIDRATAGLGLVAISPLLLVIAAGIAMSSPGPVLFRQNRVGYKGRLFQIYKFRTMHVAGQPHTRLTTRNDERVFPFGALLRKLSFDELPQLINVLNGDMSLVGPRPHMPEARAAGKLYFEAVNEYAGRHRVKPGMTGWAQVNGWRGPTETLEQIERRVEHDIYYIENWSLMLDAVILIKTVFVGFFGKNAF
jgi:Undecaprenyl-phosphate glucose phosphotransferase